MNHILLALVPFLFVTGCEKNEIPLPMPRGSKLIDVRTQQEYGAGHLAGALLIPHGEITARIDGVAPDKATPIYLYCRSGHRAGIALDALKEKGYGNVYNLGGIGDAGKTLQLPIEK